ncbi:hypothetical protein DdX_00771 [Ditylenchus destructor]|uniref:Uncharacterized protein n=1 Tax=Ditylenchus destructor TaxID=166010 RepID=A0AAD4NKI5_9BILA|nr:hypothetical protein DdX_00771 [Ditylenchus destructor]
MYLTLLRRVIVAGKDGRSRWLEKSQLYLPGGGKKHKTGELFMVLSIGSLAIMTYIYLQGERYPDSWYASLSGVVKDGHNQPRRKKNSESPDEETVKMSDSRLKKFIKDNLYPETQVDAYGHKVTSKIV